MDLTDKEAALDAHCTIVCGHKHKQDATCLMECPDYEVFNYLPPAQPERKRGEWIDYTEDGYVECPFCHSATNCDGNKDELHFCFSCGADMRGEQDE